MNFKVFFMVALVSMLASCGGRYSVVMDDNDTSACDTGSFDTLSTDGCVGVVVKNNARVKIKSITVYVDNTTPFYVEVKSVHGSEPNRIYADDSVVDYLDNTIICKPKGRGFCTVEFADTDIVVCGDIFVLFSAASDEAEAPRLAKCRQMSDSRFLAASTANGSVTYSDVEGFDVIPPFVSFGLK